MDQLAQKKALMDAPWMTCECGGISFTQIIMIKRISKLMTGGAHDSVMEIPMFKCEDCNKMPEFSTKPFDTSEYPIPAEMKAVKPLIG